MTGAYEIIIPFSADTLPLINPAQQVGGESLDPAAALTLTTKHLPVSVRGSNPEAYPEEEVGGDSGEEEEEDGSLFVEVSAGGDTQ